MGLMPGTATTDTGTVATDGEATTGLTATTVTTERGPLRLSLQLSPLLLLTLTPTLMRGTDTTDTVATDGVATTGLTATMVTTDTVVTTATDTDTATTAPPDTGVTGAKPT